jgi:hypothetical protein
MTSSAPTMVDSTAGGSIPQPPVQTPPTPTATPTTMENGGATPWGQYVRKLNWVEVGFMILGTAAFLYMIRYYKYRLYTDRDSIKNLERRCDELKVEQAKMKTPPKKQQRGGF